MNGESCKLLALSECRRRQYYTGTSIDDLSDELLLDILCKLPHYHIALRCKTVSKRWCSLISDPLFATQGFLAHQNVVQEKLSWTLLLTVNKREDDTLLMATITPPYSLRMLRSPNLSLQFLPSKSHVVATYEDVFLCFNYNRFTEVGTFIVCNPITKQWLALPPCESYQDHLIWAGLVCQKGQGFRVIVVYSIPRLCSVTNDGFFRSFDLLIYLSETEEWKNVKVRLPVRPYDEGCSKLMFSSVVCKGMVCLRHYSSFGAFNPFDVTPTFGGPLVARGIRLPKFGGMLLESCGKLVALDPYIPLMVNLDGSCDLAGPRLIVEKLNLMLGNDEQPWKIVSRLTELVKVKGCILPPSNVRWELRVVCVHPKKEHLVYFRANRSQLVVCNTRSGILKRVTSTPHKVMVIRKLKLMCWPTPICLQK